ncbi:hypothetical protein TCAL_13585 [Tigriopus californicus]|uniref:Uncharacterized protein n=1 Tax=Tigriopus californicus TaxID=6832 RepID=A0A553PU44_TIGCA|nr:uncharacterized protein LOC131892007 [Tigriopus californicus]TRY81213.1 hypothetical protein TCAL_13585 [Tigriopus californicus]
MPYHFEYDNEWSITNCIVGNESDQDIEPTTASIESLDTTVSFDLTTGQRRILQEQLNGTVNVTPPPSSPARSRSASPNDESTQNNLPARGRGGSRGRGRGRGNRRAKAPSTIAGRFIENRGIMEANFLSDQHKIKQEILELEKQAAVIYKNTLEKKAENEECQFNSRFQHEAKLFDIERKKAADLAHLEVMSLKFRVRRERALTIKAEKEAGLNPMAGFDDHLLP